MAAHRHRGANPLPNPNGEADAEEGTRAMGYYMAPRAMDSNLQSYIHPWPPKTLRSSPLSCRRFNKMLTSTGYPMNHHESMSKGFLSWREA
ncbi:unnamed protein product [Linum trigynum]|uniref:Uncharacterized protein n=1 Tax=Linum trigynum TaxID=586398 RepID=A0AAV2G9C8_9ROSI